MDFGKALSALKEGRRAARSGWNGKGMFIYLNPGSLGIDAQAAVDQVEGVSRALFEVGDRDTVARLPNINMCSASGATVTGWLASQTDLLAEDWVVLEN